MSQSGGHVGDFAHQDWYIQTTDRASQGEELAPRLWCYFAVDVMVPTTPHENLH